LNLDQVIHAIATRRPEFPLKPYFSRPLVDPDAIVYRQEIMRDLEHPGLFAGIDAFLSRMTVMQRYLGLVEKLDFHYHQEGWLLEAVHVYCTAVTHLENDLQTAPIQSRGLRAFREFLTAYAHSAAFADLLAETQKRKADLATVRYAVLIKGRRVHVRPYEGEADYSQEVAQTFAKFQRDEQRRSTNPRACRQVISRSVCRAG
jgi:hypothetical protein